MPVGAELTTSIGLKPMPLDVGLTNQGSSQPMKSSVAEPMLKIQKVLVPAPRGRRAVGSTRSQVSRRPRLRLGTGGDVHAEEPGGPEGEDDHQDREDQRVAPLSARQLTAEHVDNPDHEAADAGSDDVADAAEDRSGEGDDAKPVAQAPLDRVIVEAVDDPPGGGERRPDEEGRRDGAVDVDAAEQRRVAVLGGGAHGLAERGDAHE